MPTNKHVIVAMLVTPVLAIIAWFGVGEFKGEKPHVATPGQSYPLVEQSNCRYDSGYCELQNEDFKLQMTLRDHNDGALLKLVSHHPLDRVLASVGPADNALPPRAMQVDSNEGTRWQMRLEGMPGPDDRVRVVAIREGTTWFGEVTTQFTQGNARAEEMQR